MALLFFLVAIYFSKDESIHVHYFIKIYGHSCCLAVGLTSLYIMPFLWPIRLVPQIFWQTFSAFHCTNKLFFCFPKGCVCFCAFQICGSLRGSFMYYSSSTFCMLFRCWWQHYGCRWESATLFSLIFGCICYFGRLVLLSSHSLSLSISSVSWDIYLRTNSNQTWFIIELTQIKF